MTPTKSSKRVEAVAKRLAKITERTVEHEVAKWLMWLTTEDDGDNPLTAFVADIRLVAASALTQAKDKPK